MQNPTIPAATPAIFQFDNSQIRTVTKDGEPWFVAADVCSVLEIGNVSMAVSRLDEDECTLSQIEGSHRQTNIVNESGLFSLILRSDKPEAKRFKKWVTSEVLPTIRKTGGYHLPQTYTAALEQLLVEVKTREANQHKVDFYNAVADSSDLILVREAAKVLAIPQFGQNNLFKMLRRLKVLMEDNEPYQWTIDRGYFMVREGRYMKKGEQMVSRTTMVTQKGLEFIRKIIIQNMQGGLFKYAPACWVLPPEDHYTVKQLELL